VQHRSSSGSTVAARIKALLLYTQAVHGPAEADALLSKLRMDRDYLNDETHLVPNEVWHAALVAVVSRWGRGALDEVVPWVVAPETLGVWTHVLRGATSPRLAFTRLDRFGGEHVRIEAWRTIDSGMHWWRGATRVDIEAMHERDGLCAHARGLELAGVPLLFGLKRGVVREIPAPATGFLAFEVTWQERGTSAVTGGFLAGLGGAVPAAIAAGEPWHAALAGALSLVLGGATGYLVRHELRRRAQSHTQLVRIQALERAATLRETREQGTAGFHPGMLIAGHYRLAEKLGVGASGTIWEAERLSDGMTVAIKLLRAPAAHDTVAADRLRREAAALGLAWHPNVVELFDDGHLPDGTSYLVMERLYGESLAHRLKKTGPLSVAQVMPVALSVCDALGAVHAAGIVHRDVKPSNIYIAREPDDASKRERVKILDFGVARIEWAETRLTNTNAPLGTPGYMSPEQEQGLEIDQRTDLYALGGVLYECLTGRPPPLRSADLWQAIEESSSPQSGVQRTQGTIPEVWRRVIEKATSPLPRDRYADARGFKEALLELDRARRESA
jgi:hypothetical protein